MNAPITFNIQSSFDMLQKLQWEIHSIEQGCSHPKAAVYFALNGAITGWHLHDWIWTTVKEDFPLRAKLARLVGCQPSDFKAEEFGRWAADTNRDVGVCQMIATSAKHVGFTLHREMEASVSAKSAYADDLDSVPDFDALTDFDSLAYDVWIPKVTTDQSKRSMVDVLKGAHQFWTIFLETRLSS